MERHVEFISYTGEWPNLCSGVLTLKIDGEEVRFGHDYRIYDSYKTDGNYHSFWSSGGGVYFSSDWSCTIEEGRWIIDESELPEQYRKYAEEISEEFNSNVRYGCCGGCV